MRVFIPVRSGQKIDISPPYWKLKYRRKQTRPLPVDYVSPIIPYVYTLVYMYLFDKCSVNMQIINLLIIQF